MNPTKIEYLTHTWNPIVMRCTPLSAGCKNCWHLAMANRMRKNPKLTARERATYKGETLPWLFESRLDDPMRRKKPAVIGVQFMGDLGHPDIPFDAVSRVFEKISLIDYEHHAFLFLTKRPKRFGELFRLWMKEQYNDVPHNFWIGVSVEDQRTADERIPILLKIPAARHFISYEPAIGKLNIDEYIWKIPHIDTYRIDWVIAGCESGPGRRPAKVEWFRDLKNQCVDAGVPFFLKQRELDVFGKGKKIFKMPPLDGQVWDQICR